MEHPSFGLTAEQIQSFVEQGFVRIDEAFSRDLAAVCRAILWRATGLREDDPTTWTQPVVRLGHIPHPSFVEAANTPRLRAAYDALVGEGRWSPLGAVGTFPIRFPSDEAPLDDGWHIDTSLGWETTSSFLEWRSNFVSDGRALLTLFLFSDVGEHDAPTRLRIGSHLPIARALHPHGEHGCSLGELVRVGIPETQHLPEAQATGPAGTVFLCHPFLVHAAQAHRGTTPRFLAQPPLLPRERLDPLRTDGRASPVERAIARALTEGTGSAPDVAGSADGPPTNAAGTTR